MKHGSPKIYENGTGAKRVSPKPFKRMILTTHLTKNFFTRLTTDSGACTSSSTMPSRYSLA